MRATRVLLLAAVAAGFGATIPAHSAPVATCVVVADSQGDPAEIAAPDQAPDQAKAVEPLGDSADPASDVRGVRLGMGADLLVAEVRVADLSNQHSNNAHRWEVVWRGVGGKESQLWAERPSRGIPTFGWSRDLDTGSATGVFEIARDTIRIEAPAALVGARDGDRLTEIQARTWEIAGSAKAWQRDAAPDQTDYGVAYVAGAPCAQQDARACPVVLDPARDAGTLVHRGRTDVPDSPQAVDVLATGASAEAETIHLSIRVVRPAAPAPQGYSSVGWTVSWFDGMRHWFAQAARFANGIRYSYGIDAGTFAPSGPVSGGVSTIGRVEGRVVEIDVPRVALGSADGVRWAKFGATAWALSDTGTDDRVGAEANPFRVFDETGLGRWRVGVACSA